MNANSKRPSPEALPAKPDWPEARERLCAWWEGRRVDRTVAIITAPRRGAVPRPRRGGIPQVYIDPETVLHNVEAGVESTFHGGEAIPLHWVNPGPIPMTGYVGGEMRFEADTVWHPRRFDTWDAAGSLAFDPANLHYRTLCELTRASVRQSAGRWCGSGQGVGGCTDVMAEMDERDPALIG